MGYLRLPKNITDANQHLSPRVACWIDGASPRHRQLHGLPNADASACRDCAPDRSIELDWLLAVNHC
jgi:hypothetical protein